MKLSLEKGFKRSITYNFTGDGGLEDMFMDHARKYEFADITWYPSKRTAIYRYDFRVPPETTGDGVFDFIGFQSNSVLVSKSVRATGKYPISSLPWCCTYPNQTSFIDPVRYETYSTSKPVYALLATSDKNCSIADSSREIAGECCQCGREMRASIHNHRVQEADRQRPEERPDLHGLPSDRPPGEDADLGLVSLHAAFENRRDLRLGSPDQWPLLLRDDGDLSGREVQGLRRGCEEAQGPEPPELLRRGHLQRPTDQVHKGIKGPARPDRGLGCGGLQLLPSQRGLDPKAEPGCVGGVGADGVLQVRGEAPLGQEPEGRLPRSSWEVPELRGILEGKEGVGSTECVFK